MSDRLKGFVVVLEQDVREDDAESIITALKMIKGVIEVQPIPVDGLNDAVVEMRVRHILGEKLVEVIYPKTSR